MNPHSIADCPTCRGKGVVRRVNPGWLRMTRERAGLSLRQLARSVRFSAPYISDIELGRRRCTDQIFAEYERLFKQIEARKP
jgi:ribosome-binding protein aMBF1 (putative translation factor)